MEKLPLLCASEAKIEIRMGSVIRDETEITTIYDRHVNTVYRVCFSLMGNRSDAEDAVQTVFLKLMKDTVKFTDHEHEKAWLITTAQNQCRDIHRQWWRKKVVMIDTTVEAIRVEPEEPSVMLETIMKLPMKLRLVLFLYYYEGYKVHEISDMLRININTVKTHLRNAKKRLKMEIGDDF